MATISVPSCGLTDVQNAINSAASMDILIIPSGSASWTGQLTINKLLDIRFDPNSIIIDNYPDGDLIVVTEQINGSIKIRGGRFIYGTGPIVSIPYHYFHIFYTAGGHPVVCTDMFFDCGFGANCFGLNTNRGVIARSSAISGCSGGTCGNSSSFVRLKPIGLGDVWNRPHLWGSRDTQQNQSLFVENCTLFNVFEGVDIDDNGTCVIRRCNFTNSGIVLHGIDTGFDGARACEIYDNNLLADMVTVQCAPDLPAGTNSMVRVRSGTIKLFNNLIQDITSPAWGDKNETSYACDELRRNAGRFPCWSGGYPSFHQTGWGYTVGGTSVGGQFQDLEPIYIWNNTGAGNYNSPTIIDYTPNECGGGAATITDFVQLGREVILGTAPNYSPASYPHPLLINEERKVTLMGAGAV